MSEESLTNLRVLLVEDSCGDAILVEKAIAVVSHNQWQVQKAHTLEAGVKALEQNDYDVVLLDLSLPDSSGFDGLLSLQNMSPELPVVILTAYADAAMSLKAVGHGAQDYLFKDKMDGPTIKRAIQFAIQRKKFEAVLITRANFDPLTSLANRNLFENRLDLTLTRNKRTGAGVGVFMLDLNRFKAVNDTLGHAAGDHLLQQVAERLKHSVRAYDTAARFGGDEFAILLDGIQNNESCNAIADKIIHQVEQPFTISGNPVAIGVSIGIATCMASENHDRETLMKRADEAMYAAKLTGASAFKFF